MRQHNYSLKVKWTGNNGMGTNGYKTYERSHQIMVEGKEIINGSADPSFNGDKTKYNPEELLLATISSCHMLCYLHLCVEEGIVVTTYFDNAEGIMTENKNGSGQFEKVNLKPLVNVANSSMKEKATQLHKSQ